MPRSCHPIVRSVACFNDRSRGAQQSFSLAGQRFMPSIGSRMSAARSVELTVPTRSSRWASRACSRGAVCRRFKPWAHLGIVERRPSNGQAGRALPRPGCGPPRWPRPRWPAWAVSGRKVGRLGHQPAPGAGRDGKRLLGASGRRTRAAGSATCPSSRCLPTVSAASAVTSTHSPTA